MEICLIGKPSSDTTPKPKRTPKQKKVETINSDSDSEFGIPKKTTTPKGEDYLCITPNMPCGKYLVSYSLNLERLGTYSILSCFTP